MKLRLVDHQPHCTRQQFVGAVSLHDLILSPIGAFGDISAALLLMELALVVFAEGEVLRDEVIILPFSINAWHESHQALLTYT